MASYPLLNGFFDNKNDDRIYSAAYFRHFLNMYIGKTCTLAKSWSAFVYSGLTVTFAPGFTCFYSGYFGWKDSQFSITLTPNTRNYVKVKIENRVVSILVTTDTSSDTDILWFDTDATHVTQVWHKGAKTDYGFNITSENVRLNDPTVSPVPGMFYFPLDTRNNVESVNANQTITVTKTAKGSGKITSTGRTVRGRTVFYTFSETLIEDMLSQQLSGFSSIPANANILSVSVKTNPSAYVDAEKIFYYSGSAKKNRKPLTAANVKALLEAGHRGDIGWDVYAYHYGQSTVTYTVPDGESAPSTSTQKITYSDDLTIKVVYSVGSQIASSIVKTSRASNNPTQDYQLVTVTPYVNIDDEYVPAEIFRYDSGSWKRVDCRTD